MRTRMRVRCASGVVTLLGLALGCGGGTTPAAAPKSAARAALPDVRIAEGKPPLVLVARDGDPAAAVAVAISTAGIAATPAEAPEIATALAGLLEARLASLSPTVVPSWDGLRATVLAQSDRDAASAADAIRTALLAPVTEADVAAAKRKLAALAARPLRDPALATWARCIGSPFASPPSTPRLVAELSAARLESSRKAAAGPGRVALSVVGPRGLAEATWAAVSKADEWPVGKALDALADADGSRAIESVVYEGALEGATPLEVHLTLVTEAASASVTLAEAMGDPQGPLAARLAALDPPFRLREVAGTAHVRRGCVGVVLDAAPSRSAPADANDLVARVADAVALVHAEARMHLAEGATHIDGRALARRAGDAEKAAERAAWWGLVSPSSAQPASTSPTSFRGSVALGLSSRLRGASPRADASKLHEARDARSELLAAAVERATSAWQRPLVEGRTRVEAGQGEAWLLFGSPCGTDAETDADAGLAAVVASGTAEVARTAPDARVEPWISPDGIGLLVHGPARDGESAAAHARRLADVVGRAFAAEPLSPLALTRARANVVRASAPAFFELASALAPRHPSWITPFGQSDVALRSADAAVVARAQSLRGGPLRLAVLADESAAQGEAALRAVDRWVERRGEAGARACSLRANVAPAKAGTYVASLRGGATPEAWIAYPFPAEAAAKEAATIVAAALDGAGGLLERAFSPSVSSPSPLASAWAARVVGWPRSPALAVRIVAPDAALDGAVLQARALADRLRTAGLSSQDRDRATAETARARVTSLLDPRARLVATFRGEPVPTAGGAAPAPPLEAVKAFTAAHLGEDAMIVVAARPPRGPVP